MSVAALSGHLTLSPSFQWIGTYPALITFSVATVLEIIAYYVPWLDNLLDSIATPSAIVAGTIVTASMVAGLDPYLQWTLAVIAGGGAAGLVQGATVITRTASTTATGGLANFVVSTGEFVLSAITSVLALVLPIAALLLLGVVGMGVGFQVRKRLQRKSPAPPQAIPPPSQVQT